MQRAITLELADLAVVSSPIILLLLWFACRGVPALIEWRRERKYQAEWHRTFGREHVGTSQRTKVGQPRAASCAGADGWPHPGSATPFLSFSCPSATNRLAVV